MSNASFNSNPPHIAIIDDDPSVRRSLGMLLETRAWTYTEYERASDFLEETAATKFNCLLIDIRIPGVSGLELFEELKRRSRISGDYLPPALFLSGHGDIPMVVHALKQGAADFLEKPVDHRTLIDAISKAIASDKENRQSFNSIAKLSAEIAELTLREREVLTEIVAGHLSKQIAAHLNISTKTVETHRLHICQKFNVRTSMELAAKLRDVPTTLWRKS